MIYIITIIST